jgi:hypothetical protein
MERKKERFFAWLIDIIIVSIVIQILYSIISGSSGIDLKSFPLRSLAFFLDWTFFESIKGQSIGKMVLKVKTIKLLVTIVSTADIKSNAIQSFGKSFLLSVDLILGWIFTNRNRDVLS